MKTFKLSSAAKFFLTGALSGIILISAFSFIHFGKPLIQPQSKTITAEEANTFLKSYLTRPFPNDKPDKGVAIDVDQYNIMSDLLSKNSKLAGFRIYYGIDEKNTNIGIVVGIGADGKDVTGSIYSSSSIHLGPCPPVCDASSPITNEK